MISIWPGAVTEMVFMLGEKTVPDVSMDVGEAEVAPSPAEGEFLVVDAELVKNSGPEVVDG